MMEETSPKLNLVSGLLSLQEKRSQAESFRDSHEMMMGFCLAFLCLREKRPTRLLRGGTEATAIQQRGCLEQLSTLKPSWPRGQ